MQRKETLDPKTPLSAAGHQETVEALLQFSGSLAMFSRKPSFNRRRLSLAPDRLQCSGNGRSHGMTAASSSCYSIRPG
jgi:hypothetical protein